MPLPIHLFIHLLLAVLSGYLIGRVFNRPLLGLIFGIIGGFFIDLDHVLEYFLVFGNFDLQYFFEGRQFLKSDLVRLYFHAWEWLPVLVLPAVYIRGKARVILLALAFSMGVHLVTDSLINHYPLRFYSIIYRESQGYSAPRLLSQEEYQKNMQLKAELGL